MTELKKVSISDKQVIASVPGTPLETPQPVDQTTEVSKPLEVSAQPESLTVEETLNAINSDIAYRQTSPLGRKSLREYDSLLYTRNVLNGLQELGLEKNCGKLITICFIETDGKDSKPNAINYSFNGISKNDKNYSIDVITKSGRAKRYGIPTGTKWTPQATVELDKENKIIRIRRGRGSGLDLIVQKSKL